MTILERDKKREGGIVLTMPTTNDAVVVQNRPAPKGKSIFESSACVAPPRHSHHYASLSRLAFDPNLDFQNAYYLCVNQ